jgi:hypothetical protein
VGGFYENGNKPSDYIKSREFLNYLNNYYPLRKDSIP